MTDLPSWAGRLKSRWRKWARDPAAFVDDLPSSLLRGPAVFGLGGGTLLVDLLDLRNHAAWADWKAKEVSLRRMPDGAHFRFVSRFGEPPELWPDRVLVAPNGVSAVVVAFAEDGGRMTATEVGPGRPGVIALERRPAWARVYQVGAEGSPPERLKVWPVTRSGLAHRMHLAGARMSDALKSAWPPVERRGREPSGAAYRAWIARNEPGEKPAPAPGVLISVLMPVHDPRPEHLKAALDSVRGQSHADWRLCIADDASQSDVVRRLLDEATADPRVRLVRRPEAGGVVEATNAALELAEGDGVLFLDHDDQLAPGALAWIAAALAARPDAAAVYADEDRVDFHGRRSAPQFKPALDHERLLAQNYVNHPFAVRLDLVRRLGGLRAGSEGAQDHDLVLRIIEAGAGPILHVPKILYHWRSFPGGGSFSQRHKARVDLARARVVGDHLARTGRRAVLRSGPRGHLVVERALPEPAPEVLAIVPSRDRPGLLEPCVAGLLQQTDYPDLKVCVVDNGSEGPAALALLARLAAHPRVRVLRIEGPFNFAHLNNAAALGGREGMLAFVNDDVMVVEPGWLKAMVALAAEADVGAVGAKLAYPDGRIQHAGIVLGLGPQRVAGHEFRGAPGDTPGPQNRLLVNREVSAVTAACMVVERRKFEAVGGFDEDAFPVAFNDVDLCLKLADRGWLTVWTPQARLMHLESATRGPERPESARFAGEARRFRERWKALLGSDRFYSPNLTLEDESFTLAASARADSPWR